MKKIILLALFLALPMVSIHAASDYYLKLGGVDGETTMTTPAASTITVSGTLTIEAGTLSLGEAFVLDGTKSQDDGVAQRFLWKQVSGPAVRFADPSAIKQSVTPTVAGTYVFELSVIDATGLSSVARRIEVKVTDVAAASGEMEQTASDMYLEIKGVDGETKKGNVEINWKVEEGEKGAGAENDRLINAGPRNDWPLEGIRVGSGDVRGLTDEEKTQRLTEVKAWAEIQSEQDLKNFATGVLLKDVRIKGMKIMENLIEVDYEMPGKLFGFIPFGYSVRISVDRGNNENWDFGRTKIKFPWYSFLLRKGLTIDEINAAVQQEDKVNIAVGDVNGDGFDSAAQAVTLISNVLKTKHDTVKNSIGNIR